MGLKNSWESIGCISKWLLSQRDVLGTLSLVQHAVNAYQSSQNTLCSSLNHNSKSKKNTDQMYFKNNTHKAQKIKQGQLPSKHPPLLHAIPISHSLLVNSRYRREQSSSILFLDDETASSSKTDFWEKRPSANLSTPVLQCHNRSHYRKSAESRRETPGELLSHPLSHGRIFWRRAQEVKTAPPLFSQN